MIILLDQVIILYDGSKTLIVNNLGLDSALPIQWMKDTTLIHSDQINVGENSSIELA